MIHAHVTGWVIAFILLFIVFSAYRSGKNGKALHMVLRLIYLVIIGTGIGLLIISPSGNQVGELVVKVIAGLWAIVSIEMITVRANKGESTRSFWIQFVIAAVIAIVLGFFRLPL